MPKPTTDLDGLSPKTALRFAATRWPTRQAQDLALRDDTLHSLMISPAFAANPHVAILDMLLALRREASLLSKAVLPTLEEIKLA